MNPEQIFSKEEIYVQIYSSTYESYAKDNTKWWERGKYSMTCI